MSVPGLVWMKRESGSHRSHAFIDGNPLCHCTFRPAGEPAAWGGVISPLVPSPLNEHGLPYGRTCTICLDRAQRMTALQEASC